MYMMRVYASECIMDFCKVYVPNNLLMEAYFIGNVIQRRSRMLHTCLLQYHELLTLKLRKVIQFAIFSKRTTEISVM